MKNTWMMVGFVVIAIAVIWGAVWYSGQMAQPAATAQVATTTTATGTSETSPTITTSSTQTMGLEIKDIVVGTGTVAQNGDTIGVLYTGKLDDGTVFDASSLHGNQPFSFVLGAGQVIQGWDLGVAGMKVGGTRDLTIPANLGYGAAGAGGGSIPPNATLHFEVQLLTVNGSK